MQPAKKDLLKRWPAYRDDWRILVKGNQRVEEIIEAVINSHHRFAGYYDKIAELFDNGQSVRRIASDLYAFVEDNIKYKEEPNKLQTTALPTGILTRGYGDCKHYASFIGGVLDALNRAGRHIHWAYRFASYKLLDTRPHHVFIVINPGTDRELYIDPVPGAKENVPVWIKDVKP